MACKVGAISPVYPPFPEGELVPSFIPRLLQYARNVSQAKAYKLFFDCRPGLNVMPRRMAEFHDLIGHNYGDLRSNITGHTHIYLFLTGLPFSRHEEQYARLEGNLPGRTRLAILPPLCSAVDEAWKVCPECEEEQMDGGFTFSHRELAFDGLAVCPKHGIPLHSGGEQLLLYDKECLKTLTPAQAKNNQELGIRAAHCMRTPPELSGYHKSDVIQALQQAGWMMMNRRMLLGKFIDAFIKRFGGNLGHAMLDYLCSSEVNIENAIRNLLREERALPPLWCLLFVWFSEECKLEVPPKVERQQRTRRPTVTPTAEQIAQKLAIHGTMTATANAMNINLKRLCALATAYEIKFSSRPKVVDEALHAAIMRAYDEKVRPQEVARRFGISLGTAYAQLVSHQGNFSPSEELNAARTEKSKYEWNRLRASRSEESATALRKLNPGAWKQLRTKAPTWLRDNCPPLRSPIRTKGREMDACLQALLLASWKKGNDLFTSPGNKPVRKSGYRMRAATGIRASVLRRSKASGVLQEYLETHEEYIQRRLDWAFPHGFPEDTPTWFRAKKCGVRESSLLKILNATHNSKKKEKP